MMPPTDGISQQSDPGPAATVSQERQVDGYLAVSLALQILQFNVEGLSAAKTKFEGGLTIPYDGEEDAVSWLNSVVTTLLAK